jgi:hypothetical protein
LIFNCIISNKMQCTVHNGIARAHMDWNVFRGMISKYQAALDSLNAQLLLLKQFHGHWMYVIRTIDKSMSMLYNTKSILQPGSILKSCDFTYYPLFKCTQTLTNQYNIGYFILHRTIKGCTNMSVTVCWNIYTTLSTTVYFLHFSYLHGLPGKSFEIAYSKHYINPHNCEHLGTSGILDHQQILQDSYIQSCQREELTHVTMYLS